MEGGERKILLRSTISVLWTYFQKHKCAHRVSFAQNERCVSVIAQPSECAHSHKCATGCTVVDTTVRGSYIKRATLNGQLHHAGITPTSVSCVLRRGLCRVGSFGCEELPTAEECVKLQKVAISGTHPHQGRQTVAKNVVAFAHYVPSHGRFLKAEHAPLQPITIHYCLKSTITALTVFFNQI